MALSTVVKLAEGVWVGYDVYVPDWPGTTSKAFVETITIPLSKPKLGLLILNFPNWTDAGWLNGVPKGPIGLNTVIFGPTITF